MASVDPDDFIRSHPRIFNTQKLHNDTHFNSDPNTKQNTPHDGSHAGRHKFGSYHENNTEPVRQPGEDDRDFMLRHDAYLTANHLFPGKPDTQTKRPASQNLGLDGRVHDWVMRQNKTNANALVTVARQEYYNSLNKHDSFY